MSRKISVRRHQRKKPSGGETTVRRHTRRIVSRNPQILGKAKYRGIHFLRPIGERVIDEETTEPYVKDPEDWVGREKEVDISGLDDALPSNVYIEKSGDVYAIGFVRADGKELEFKDVTYITYERRTFYRDTYYIEFFHTIIGRKTGTGMGTLLMREFLKDADKKDFAVSLYSHPDEAEGMNAEQRIKMYESYGFKLSPGETRRTKEGYRYGDMIRPSHSKRMTKDYELEKTSFADEISSQLKEHEREWQTGKKRILGTGTRKKEPADFWSNKK